MSTKTPQSAVPAEAPELDLPRVDGWEALAELTGEIRPEDVGPLAAVRGLEAVYPLLHVLVGRSLRDFFVRSAALEGMVGAGRATFQPNDFEEVLYWLTPGARESVIGALRRSGWLAFEAGEGTTITGAGHWAHDVLSFLHRRLRENELLPTVAGVEYALQIGHDPLRLLLSMRSRLVELKEAIESARASFSEVVLRRAQARLGEALSLSNDIRKVLDKVPLDQRSAREVVRDIHDLLSQLHGKTSELHASITEIGRQYLRLSAGLTTEQVVTALMRLSVAELASVGGDALLPVLQPPSLLTTEVVAHAAELYFQKERGEDQPVDWREPPPVETVPSDVGTPEEVLRFLEELAGVVASGRPAPLSQVIPGEDLPGSFLRASLLALAGSGLAGEGVAARLGALRLDLTIAGDGWAEETAGLEPLSQLTPGELLPRPRGSTDG